MSHVTVEWPIARRVSDEVDYVTARLRPEPWSPFAELILGSARRPSQLQAETMEGIGW
jgi:hypothetical protein